MRSLTVNWGTSQFGMLFVVPCLFLRLSTSFYPKFNLGGLIN